MSCMSVGNVSTVPAGQTASLRTEVPSLLYDDKGVLKAALAALAENCNAANAKQLSEARIKQLEVNRDNMESKASHAGGESVLAIAAGIAIGVLCPPVAIISVPVGLIKGAIDAHHSGCTGVKRHWLQVELDAEKAFIDQHPEKIGDDQARKEFVYSYIFNHDPGYELEEDPEFGSSIGWVARRHVFPEAQVKYDEIASKKPLPVITGYSRR